MSSDHVNPYAYQSEPEANQYGEPERKRSKLASCLIGCLIAFAVFIVLAIIVVFWAARHWRGWFANFGMEFVNQGIDQSDLAPQEKVKLKEQVERVGKAFASGEISLEQAGAIIQKLTKSPLMASLIVMGVDKQYFDKSGLTVEEKTQGRDALRRFSSGAIAGKINQQDVDAVLSHVADRKGDNGWELRKHVSDDELRAAIAEAKSRADKAGIPLQPEKTIQPSEELKRIVDEALQEKK